MLWDLARAMHLLIFFLEEAKQHRFWVVSWFPWGSYWIFSENHSSALTAVITTPSLTYLLHIIDTGSMHAHLHPPPYLWLQQIKEALYADVEVCTIGYNLLIARTYFKCLCCKFDIQISFWWMLSLTTAFLLLSSGEFTWKWWHLWFFMN